MAEQLGGNRPEFSDLPHIIDAEKYFYSTSLKALHTFISTPHTDESFSHYNHIDALGIFAANIGSHIIQVAGIDLYEPVKSHKEFGIGKVDSVSQSLFVQADRDNSRLVCILQRTYAPPTQSPSLAVCLPLTYRNINSSTLQADAFDRHNRHTEVVISPEGEIDQSLYIRLLQIPVLKLVEALQKETPKTKSN